MREVLGAAERGEVVAGCEVVELGRSVVVASWAVL